MESRMTLRKNQTFSDILSLHKEQGDKVALLIDNNGLSRAEGKIKTMRNDVAQPYIELDNDQHIDIDTIVAVNGIFADPYSEC